MSDIEWLLFLAQLPATPSSLRVNVWRRLRDAGSTSLQNGVWILPCTDKNKVFMERLLAYVKQSGASGQIFLVQSLDQAIQESIFERFNADRDLEYDEFLEHCEAFITELETEIHNQKFTFAELEESEQNLQRLGKWITKIQERDFFKTQRSQNAVTAYQNCRKWLRKYTHHVYTREGIETSSDTEYFSENAGQSGLEIMDDLG